MGKLKQQLAWYLVGYLREAWGKFGGKSGKNYMILEKSVRVTFMNPCKFSMALQFSNDAKAVGEVTLF